MFIGMLVWLLLLFVGIAVLKWGIDSFKKDTKQAKENMSANKAEWAKGMESFRAEKADFKRVTAEAKAKRAEKKALKAAKK